MAWRPDRLLRVVLVWTMITMVVVWLPLIRGLMDGASYEWGNSLWGISFRGNGLQGDYWILPLLATFSLSLLYLGWRGARQPFHWLLLAWNVPNAIEAAYLGIRFPERYRFQGDTLGVDVSLAWFGPAFFGLLALLSIAWVVRDLRRERDRQAPDWTRKNQVVLIATISFLPVQFVLLRIGADGDLLDVIGVLLTILQWVMVSLAFFPWRAKGSVAPQTAT